MKAFVMVWSFVAGVLFLLILLAVQVTPFVMSFVYLYQYLINGDEAAATKFFVALGVTVLVHCGPVQILGKIATWFADKGLESKNSLGL
jgi:uncharacterized membrane-anchored protein